MSSDESSIKDNPEDENEESESNIDSSIKEDPEEGSDDEESEVEEDDEEEEKKEKPKKEKGAGITMEYSNLGVPSPKAESIAGVDYEYGQPKKFIHDYIYTCYPDKWVRHDWDVCICMTCFRVPQYYCLGCCCAQCYAFIQRKALLGDKMDEEYMCCQGAYGKCWCAPCWRFCPHVGLFLESFICPSCAISGNRLEMQKIFPTADTLCETIIMLIGAILSFFGLFASLILCLTNGCLNSQQEREWIKNEEYTSMTPYTRWGDDNFICDCTKCEPCCGEPCNPLSGLYCCLCWTCCYCPSAAKLLAYENDQDCQLVNHCGLYIAVHLWMSLFPSVVTPLISMTVPCLLPCLLPLIPYGAIAPYYSLRTVQRHNLRVAADVGRSSDYFGDCLLSNCWCTCLCADCQQCRTVPAESWDWLGAMTSGKVGVFDADIKYIANDDIYIPGSKTEWENQPIPGCLCFGGEEDEEGDDNGNDSEEKED